MEFVVLGPLEAREDGRRLTLGGPKQRAVLAMLLLDANRPLPRDRLIDGLWGESPPPSAAHTLDDYVSRLRRTLGGARIERGPGGYLIRVEPGELDPDHIVTPGIYVKRVVLGESYRKPIESRFIREHATAGGAA